MGIDGLLIDHAFQPLQDKSQRFCGKNCFILAKFSYLLSAGFVTYRHWILGSFKHENLSEFAPVFLLLFIMYAWLFTRVDRIEGRCGDKFVNMERLNGRFFRIVMLFLLCMATAADDQKKSLPHALNVADQLFFTAGFYFSACTPLPPSESKIGNWINAFKKVFETAVGPEPVKLKF